MKGQSKEAELSAGFGRTLLQLLVLLKKCNKIMTTGYPHHNLKDHLTQSVGLNNNTGNTVQIYLTQFISEAFKS